MLVRIRADRSIGDLARLLVVDAVHDHEFLLPLAEHEAGVGREIVRVTGDAEGRDAALQTRIGFLGQDLAAVIPNRLKDVGVKFLVACTSAVAVQDSLAQSQNCRVEIHLRMPCAPHAQHRNGLRILAQFVG